MGKLTRLIVGIIFALSCSIAFASANPTYVQGTSGTFSGSTGGQVSGSNTATIALTLPATPSPGDVLIGFPFGIGANTETWTSTGFTQLVNNYNATGAFYAPDFYDVLGASPSNTYNFVVTTNGTSAFVDASLADVSGGAAPTQPGSMVSGTGLTVTCPNTTVATTGSLVFCVVLAASGNQSSGTTFASTPSGWTAGSVYQVYYNSVIPYYQANVASGTLTGPSITLSGSNPTSSTQWNAYTVVVAPASATPTPTPISATPSPAATVLTNITPMPVYTPAPIASAQGWQVTSAGTAVPASPAAFSTAAADTTVSVNAASTYQTWDGFGAAYAAIYYSSVPTANRGNLMRELFSPGAIGAGITALRVTIGNSASTGTTGSDDDQPTNYVDPNMYDFNTTFDDVNTTGIADFCRQALDLNPSIKVFASSWSPPPWMKNTGVMVGTTSGSVASTFLSQYSSAYATYLVDWVQAMSARGCPIYMLAVQNEPNYDPTTYAGMELTEPQEAALIGGYVGPAFTAAGLSTQICGLDHNWAYSSYEISLLADATAGPYVAGTCWHTYSGTESTGMSAVNTASTKPNWTTESDNEAPTVALAAPAILTAMQYNTRAWLFWMVMNTVNQVESVYINPASGQASVEPAWGMSAAINAALQQNAVRINASSTNGNVTAVAFENPDGTDCALVYNADAASHVTAIADVHEGQTFSVTIPAGAFETLKYGQPTSAAPRFIPHIGS